MKNYCDTCVRKEYCLQKTMTRCTWYSPKIAVKWESMNKVVINGAYWWLKQPHSPK